MQMALGLFVFTLSTVPLQSYTRTSSERFAKHDVFEKRPKYQHLGINEEPLTLNGVLFPEEITGGITDLYTLERMKQTGQSYILINGTGRVLGQYFIESINETHSVLNRDGTAKKIEFTLNLKRTDNDSSTLGWLDEFINNSLDKVVSNIQTNVNL